MKPKRTRTFCVAMAIVLLLTLLPSCTDNGGDGVVNNSEVTGSLKIYGSVGLDYLMNPSDDSFDGFLTQFEEIYPNIEIDYTIFPDDTTMIERLFSDTELETGPDLALFSGDAVDVELLLRDNDIFYDLNAFTQQDKDFDIGEFVEPVIESCTYGDKQVLMPLAYQMPVFMTTQETLDALGLALDDPSDYGQFVSLTEAFIEQYGLDGGMGTYFYAPYNSADSLSLFALSGLTPLDYDTGTVDVLTEEFNQALTLTNLLSYAEADYSKDVSADTDLLRMYSDAVVNHNALFATTTGSSQLWCYIMSAFRETETPVYFPMPSTDGKVYASPTMYAGIPEASANKENAYRFLQFLLSDEIQKMVSWTSACPFAVRKSATEATYGEINEGLSSEGYERLSSADVQDYLDLCTNPDAVRHYNYPYAYMFARGRTYYDQAIPPDDDVKNPDTLLRVEQYFTEYYENKAVPSNDQLRSWFNADTAKYEHYMNGFYSNR